MTCPKIKIIFYKEDKCIVYFVAVIKYNGQSNLWKKELILVYDSRWNVQNGEGSMVAASQSRKLRGHSSRKHEAQSAWWVRLGTHKWSQIFLWAASSQKMTWRLMINYESSAYTLGLSH